MSLDESSVLMDRALVTMCSDLPESLALYNTAKDRFSLAAIRAVPLLEHVELDSRKLHIIRDWMRAYEPMEDQPLTTDVSMDSLQQTAKRERREHARQIQERRQALVGSENESSTTDHVEKKKRKKDKKEAAKKTARTKDRVAKPRMTPKQKSNGKGKAPASHTKTKKTGGRKRAADGSDDDVLSLLSDSSESEAESSTSASSSSDSESDGKRSKKRKKATGSLPPVEAVLSSDEDEEPNDMFDTEDPDVYEVEKILDKRPGTHFGDPDLYLIKWVGYEETTWEPAANVSKDLVDEFEGQPVRDDVYTVEELCDRKMKRDKKTRLKSYLYLVKWVGYDDLTWEPQENLPHNLRRKFDKTFESRKRRRG